MESKIKEHRYTINDLGNYAYKQGKNYSEVFVDWLDWMLDIWSTDNVIMKDFPEILSQKYAENELYYQMMMQWFIDVTAELEKGNVLDWFGNQYEESIKTKGKADALGQFYTPMSLCKMIAEVSAEKQDDPDHIVADDCACGSGRTLIALEWALRKKYGYSNRRFYCGEDIDQVSVKMCALNLMVMGVCGQVLCKDSLMQITYWGYEVNEVRYPFATPLYSVRRVTKEQAEVESRRISDRYSRYHKAHVERKAQEAEDPVGKEGENGQMEIVFE